MSNDKVKKELPPELIAELDKSNSVPSQIIILLIAILRELKGIKDK